MAAQSGVPPPTTAAAQPRTVTATTTATTSTTQASGAAGTGTAGGVDTSDLATLNDALGSAGVDLRAEEESLQRTSDHHLTYRSYEDRTRKQPPKPNFDSRFLGATMRTIGDSHKITRIPDDSVNYLALALRARLQELLTSMISAAKHRTDTQFDRPASMYDDGSPMWSILVQKDVAKQLAAIEKVEREEELRIRRERKERADMAAAHAAVLAAQAAGNNAVLSTGDGFDEDGGGARKKRKKEGPGVTARNMSEDVRKKMSNAVASQAAGLGGRYSWMTAANAASANTTPVKKDKPATTASTPAMTSTPIGSSTTMTTTAAATTSTPATTTTPATSGWARPYVATKKASPTAPEPVEDDTRLPITMRDAMFVIRNERGHGGGRGAARGWT
ncbi:hypothetical protein K435DRAFT_685408 [Dendrothele bispora CBS 962.96]|uniref:Transcription initiation factor TFIID subunit 4 n=1 Tax=Dendrothele bispora (strain CBS 962.96) TaxID=1314807 RepID=A0A4S8L9V0_DENBC|nr:hypothetical protein K435DRAFT_685408 [Dendrothele bispora CBS 962.96]